jgi:hypothetical protein
MLALYDHNIGEIKDHIRVSQLSDLITNAKVDQVVLVESKRIEKAIYPF